MIFRPSLNCELYQCTLDQQGDDGWQWKAAHFYGGISLLSIQTNRGWKSRFLDSAFSFHTVRPCIRTSACTTLFCTCSSFMMVYRCIQEHRLRLNLIAFKLVCPFI